MKNTQDIRYEVLRILLKLTMLATIFAFASNIINKRPLTVVLQPAVAIGFILLIMYFQNKDVKYFYISKLVFMIFFNCIYLPIAWFYSPGVSSAIGYYAILTIVLSAFFVEKLVEFIIPCIGVVVSVGMILMDIWKAI